MLELQPRLSGLDIASRRDASRSQVTDRRAKSGLLPRQLILAMVESRMVQAASVVEDSQLQAASLDLRLGSRAYRIRASFLPGRERTVAEVLSNLKSDEINLEAGAILERGCVYLVELQEHLRLPDSIAAVANPKSSTGRLDVFTRLISNASEVFDAVEAGYEGPLYAEISPRSFSVKVRRGSRLNQIRFRRLNSQHELYSTRYVDDRFLRDRHTQHRLVDGDLTLRNGLILRVNLAPDGSSNETIGYRAQKYTDTIDIDRVSAHEVCEYWEPIYARPDGRLILDPHQFYILASAEQIHIPPDLAAEMVPIDHTMGEFRVHYAGFSTQDLVTRNAAIPAVAPF